MDVIVQARSRGTAGGYHYEGVDGELQVLDSGNEDEDVDIDDEDCDAVQHLEDSQGNGTCQGPSLTDVGIGTAGAGKDGANSKAAISGHNLAQGPSNGGLQKGSASDLQIEVGAGAERSHSQKERGDCAAESEVSIGQSHQSHCAARSLSEEDADDGKDQAREPSKVIRESTLKLPKARDFRKQLSEKLGLVRGVPSQSRVSVGLSRSQSRVTSVDKSDGDGTTTHKSEMQINSKRKASDIEPSSSMRSKRQGTKTDSPPRWSDVSAQRQNVEEIEVNNVNLTKKKGDVPSKTKEILRDRGSEGRAKTQRVPGTNQDKHPHNLLSDKVDDEEPEQLFGKESQTSNGKGKKVVGLTTPSEGNGKRTSITESPVAKKGSNSGDKQVQDDQQQLSAGGRNSALRSKFGTKAKKKSASGVPGDKKALAGAAQTAEVADKNTLFKWVTCPQCKKTRKVPADSNIGEINCSCEKNTLDPEYSSCAVPQENISMALMNKVTADKDEDLPKRDSQPEISVKSEQRDGSQHALALKIVWLKKQVGGRDSWWPGRIVTEAEVPSELYKKLSLSAELKKIVVSLFNPAQELEPYQTVTRSVLRPFSQLYEQLKSSNPHPDFKRAVNEAHSLFHSLSNIIPGQDTTSAEGGAKLTVIENVEHSVEDVRNEESQSNEIELGDAHISDVDGHSEQPQADLHMGRPKDDIVEVVGDEWRKIEEAFEPINGVGLTERSEEVPMLSSGEHKETVQAHVNTSVLEDRDASDRTKLSEVSRSEVHMIDLRISPSKTLVSYWPYRELHFQDGSTLNIDPESIGRVLNKNSSGTILHECIYQVGRENIRQRFPKRAKSSTGLDFEALDQAGAFAQRLKATWAREYRDEVMPKFLKTRFVAACIKEEKDETVNWAYEVTHDICQELREMVKSTQSEISSAVHKLITFMLEKHSGDIGQDSQPQIMSRDTESSIERKVPASVVPEIVTGEEAVNLTEYNHFCQQCTQGGELLCCDGRDCRKTYHLKCLDPPLEEVPSTSFFCPSCSLAPPSDVKLTIVKDTNDRGQSNESIQEPESTSELPILAKRTDIHEGVVSVDPKTALEGDSTTNARHNVPIANTEANVLLSGETGFPTLEIGNEINCERPLNRTEDGDLVSGLNEAPTLEGPGNTQQEMYQPGGKVDVISEAEIGVTVAETERTTIAANDGGPGKETWTVQAGLSTSILPKGSGVPSSPIELVNRDERSGSRAETSLLLAYADSGLLPAQAVINAEPELEEGEIAPQSQVGSSVKMDKLNTSMEKATRSKIPIIPLLIPSRVPSPNGDEKENPSSDDHNSFCEGCEVGGELMLCDGKGCKVVYHKECLDPPLSAVPAGEWYCPQCELKRKGSTVEKIWATREASSRSSVNGLATTGSVDNSNMDNSSPEIVEEDQLDSDDEAHSGLEDIPLNTRFKRLSQGPQAGVEGQIQVPGGPVVRGDVSETSNLKNNVQEYFVQWKSCSHAHNKWIAEKDLEKLAPKELARFRKMLAQGQGNGRSPKWNPEWAQPERVLQKRIKNVLKEHFNGEQENNSAQKIETPEVEWYVKWKALGYEQCTWEPAETGVLASRKASKLICAFDKWAEVAKQRATQEAREEAERLSKAPVKELERQPEWMGHGELLPMQLDALNQLRGWWHARKNGILVYEASQEKIVTTIIFFLSLVEDFKVVHPVLVVVPISLIQNWEHELRFWSPKLNIVNYASQIKEARDIVRQTEFNSFNEPFKPQIVLTTFEVINCDMDHFKKLEWEALIIDEGRRQRPQNPYRPLCQIKSVFRLLLLREPLKSNVEELKQFVDFLDPQKKLVMNGDEPTQFTELQRWFSGRVREFIPVNRLIEYWVPVEMTSVHLKQYYDILVKHYPTLSRNRREHQIQDVVTNLRQSCNHPFLADPTLEGSMGQGLTPKELLDAHIQICGKMQLIHLMMPILKSLGWRVLIFSQENRQLNILERYMTQSHGPESYERVDSDLAVKGKESAIQRFNAEGSSRFVLLLKTGIHISFRNVQLAIIYDSDWNPANDMRALHNVHNEGEAGSKPLPVLRLYTHHTVEESTLILHHSKEMPPARANVSAKVCQKLLTWGASKIFELHDMDGSSVESSQRPKGAKICPKAKTRRVLYDPEKVQKLLRGVVFQEQVDGDELLDAILIPREEPATLFAVSDQSMNVVTGDSAEAFWASCLKWRHEEWQSKEVNMLGKGQRGRKRVTYDEDAMATAAYKKARIADETEKKRPRRRKSSSDGEQEFVGIREVCSSPTALSPQPGTPPTSTPLGGFVTVQPSTPSSCHLEILDTVNNAVSPFIVPSMEQPPDTSLHPLVEVLDSGKGSLGLGENGRNQCAGPGFTHNGPENQPAVTPAVLATPTIPGGICEDTTGGTPVRADAGPAKPDKHKIEQGNEYLKRLAKICSCLKLTEPVKNRVHELFKHCMQTSKNLRKPGRAPHEIIAIELAVVWVAADQLQYPIDKSISIDKVEAALVVHYDNRPQLEGPLYKKVSEICSSFNTADSLHMVLPTMPQPASVPQPGTPTSCVPDLPSRLEAELSPQIVEVNAVEEQEHLDTVTQTKVSSPPGADSLSEFSTPTSVLPVLATSSCQVAPETEIVQVTEAPQAAPLETEIELVEADPRLVFDSPLRTLVTEERLLTPEIPGTIISCSLALERGLGWVIRDSTLQVPTREAEQEPSLGGVPQVVLSSSSAQAPEAPEAPAEVETSQALADLDQSHEPEMELTDVSIVDGDHSQSPALLSAQTALLPTSALTQAQVVSSEDVHVRRSIEQNAAITRAQLGQKLIADRAYVIRGQTKETERMHARFNQEKRTLKNQFDTACMQLRSTHASPGPFIDSQKSLFEIDMRTLIRHAQNEQKAMDSRQRSDRDKLNESYRKLISQIEGSGGSLMNLSNVELDIQRLKDFYSKFLVPSTQSPLQEVHGEQRLDNDRRSMRSQPPGPSISEALPLHREQTDGQILQGRIATRAGDGQSTEHIGQVPVATATVSVPSPQELRAHSLHSVPGQTITPSADVRRSAVASAASTPATIPPPPAHLQRSQAAVLASMQAQQRGASPVSRGLNAVVTGVAGVHPTVESSTAPSPASSSVPTGYAAGLPVYPDVFLKEKDKLTKELEKAKITYESESHRIKAEYDKEAELLHRKYEALLVEEHGAFTKKQQEVQQNIMKVEWNRQLADALKLRDDLVNRAGFAARQVPRTPVQVPYQQASQRTSVRPVSSGAATASAHFNAPRGTTYATTPSLAPGTHTVTSQSLGVPTTRTMAAPLNIQSPLSRGHAAPTEAVYRSMSYPGMGTSCVVPPSREQSSQLPPISSALPSNPTPDASQSPQPQAPVTTFRPPAPPVVACAPLRSDPILNIIQKSVATPLSFAVSGSPSPWEASTSTPVANSSGIVNPPVSQECAPSVLPGADPLSHRPRAALIPEDVAVQISPRADPSNVPFTQPGGDITATQEHNEIVLPRVIPASVIYLSDSDDD